MPCAVSLSQMLPLQCQCIIDQELSSVLFSYKLVLIIKKDFGSLLRLNTWLVLHFLDSFRGISYKLNQSPFLCIISNYFLVSTFISLGNCFFIQLICSHLFSFFHPSSLSGLVRATCTMFRIFGPLGLAYSALVVLGAPRPRRSSSAASRSVSTS